MTEKQETVNAYNKGASQLASKFNSLGPEVRLGDIQKALSFINKTDPRILELGCGNGRDAKQILKYTNDYLGIDISEKMIAAARANVPEGNFQVGDFEECSFPKNVDIIFAFASLLHSNKNNVKKVFRKALPVLIKNGIFFISLKLGEYHREVKKEDIGNRTYYFYTPEELDKLRPAGFQLVYQDTQELRGQKWFTVILQN